MPYFTKCVLFDRILFSRPIMFGILFYTLTAENVHIDRLYDFTETQNNSQLVWQADNDTEVITLISWYQKFDVMVTYRPFGGISGSFDLAMGIYFPSLKELDMRPKRTKKVRFALGPQRRLCFLFNGTAKENASFCHSLICLYNIDRTLRTLWLVKNLCFIRV